MIKDTSILLSTPRSFVAHLGGNLIRPARYIRADGRPAKISPPGRFGGTIQGGGKGVVRDVGIPDDTVSDAVPVPVAQKRRFQVGVSDLLRPAIPQPPDRFPVQ